MGRLYIGDKAVTPILLTGGDKIKNQTKTITENGTYTYDDGYTGLDKVIVDVDSLKKYNKVLLGDAVWDNGITHFSDSRRIGKVKVDYKLPRINFKHVASFYITIVYTPLQRYYPQEKCLFKSGSFEIKVVPQTNTTFKLKVSIDFENGTNITMTPDRVLEKDKYYTITFTHTGDNIYSGFGLKLRESAYATETICTVPYEDWPDSYVVNNKDFFSFGYDYEDRSSSNQHLYEVTGYLGLGTNVQFDYDFDSYHLPYKRFHWALYEPATITDVQNEGF